jgi:hypothetical protein
VSNFYSNCIFTLDSTLTGRIAEIKGIFTFDSVLAERIAEIKGTFTLDFTLTGRIGEFKGIFTFDSVLVGRIAEIKGIFTLDSVLAGRIAEIRLFDAGFTTQVFVSKAMLLDPPLHSHLLRQLHQAPHPLPQHGFAGKRVAEAQPGFHLPQRIA